MAKIKKYKDHKRYLGKFDIYDDQLSVFDYTVSCNLFERDNHFLYSYFVILYNNNFNISFSNLEYKKSSFESFVKDIKNKKQGSKCNIGNYILYLYNGKKIMITKNCSWVYLLKIECILGTFEKILQDERLI